MNLWFPEESLLHAYIPLALYWSVGAGAIGADRRQKEIREQGNSSSLNAELRKLQQDLSLVVLGGWIVLSIYFFVIYGATAGPIGFLIAGWGGGVFLGEYLLRDAFSEWCMLHWKILTFALLALLVYNVSGHFGVI